MKRLYQLFIAVTMSLYVGSAAAVLVAPSLAYAETPFDAVCSDPKIAAESPACKSRTEQNPLLGPNGLLSRVTQLFVIATGIVSVIIIIVAGIRYSLSAGDPKSITGAKDAILYAIIGIVVATAGQFLVLFVLQRV